MIHHKTAYFPFEVIDTTKPLALRYKKTNYAFRGALPNSDIQSIEQLKTEHQNDVLCFVSHGFTAIYVPFTRTEEREKAWMFIIKDYEKILPLLGSSKDYDVVERVTEDENETSEILDYTKFIAHHKSIISPKHYQKTALKAISKEFEHKNECQVVMACGTGKSYIGCWASDQQNVQSTIVMVPNLSLLSQFLVSWKMASKYRSAMMCVCQDQGVTREIDNLDKENSKTLNRFGIPITTSPKVVASFLKDHADQSYVIFCTYKSGDVIEQAQKIFKEYYDEKHRFDFAVCDEAHVTAGAQGRLFSKILSNKSISVKKRLFLTATPRIFNTSEVDDCFSMNNEKIYGKRVYSLGFKEAIELGILTPYKIIAIGVSANEVKNFVPDTSDDAREVYQQIALRKAVAQYGLNYILTFHRYVRSADAFIYGKHGVSKVNKFPEFKNFFLDSVSSRSRVKYRTKSLELFKGSENGILSNTVCLGQGIDIPKLDAIYFADQKYPHEVIVQSTGRVLRRSPKKKTAYILVPIFYDDNFHNALPHEKYDAVWRVIQAMAMQDDELDNCLKSIAMDFGRQKWGQSADVSNTDFLKNIIEMIDIQDQFEDFYRKILDHAGYKFETRVGELQAFRSSHHARWPGRHVNDEKEHSLANWLDRQAEQWKAGKLSDYRKSLLKDLGYQRKQLIDRWECGYAVLSKVLKQDFPISEMDKKTAKIWLQHQRARYNRGKLSSDNIQKLAQIGVSLCPDKEVWETRYSELKSFLEQSKGKMPKKSSLNKNERSLGQWIQHQKARKALSNDQIEKLQSVGVCMEKKDLWEDRFLELKQFKKQFKKLPSKWCKERSEVNLAKWVQRQRLKYRENELSRARIKKLLSLGVISAKITEKTAQNAMTL